jgi:hypothetical protein
METVSKKCQSPVVNLSKLYLYVTCSLLVILIFDLKSAYKLLFLEDLQRELRIMSPLLYR